MAAQEREPVRQPLQILLIVDTEDDVRPLEDQLAEAAPAQFVLESTTNFRESLHLISSKSFDLILLDISTFSGEGFEMFVAIREEAGDVPLVVLTTSDDEQLAVRAVNQGAQDYIVKGHVNTRHLAHSLQYAITRQRLVKKLVSESLVDELTGLYNRRGFSSLCEQQMRMAERTKRGLLLFFMDLDGMKLINDVHGHRAGDQALVDVALLLHESFRKSDVIARMGGDEFAVLAIETSQQYRDTVVNRFTDHIAEFNKKQNRQFLLSVSIGIAGFDPDNPCRLEDLLERADKGMYEQKRNKRIG